MDQGNTGTLHMNGRVLEAVNSTGHSKGRALLAAHSGGIQCHLSPAALHTLDGTKTLSWAVGAVLAPAHHGHRVRVCYPAVPSPSPAPQDPGVPPCSRTGADGLPRETGRRGRAAHPPRMGLRGKQLLNISLLEQERGTGSQNHRIVEF